MIRYIPQPCDTDPNELESLADFHVSRNNERTASILRAYAATLRQQAGRVDEDEGFDPRKFVRHMADVLEAGGDLFKIDADLARLGAAIQAALAQNTQGDWVLVPREPTPEMLAAVEGATCTVRVAEDDSAEYPLSEDECAEIYRNMLAAAPSQRAEVKP